jgi:hypothetical protein
MPYGVPSVAVAPTVAPGDAQAVVSMGATPASQGATIIQWVVSGWDNAGHTVTNKVAGANQNGDGGFSLAVALVGPNVWGRTWQFTAIPRVRSENGQIKEGGQSPVSSPAQPKGVPGTPNVTIAAQQGVSGNNVILLFAVTRGDGNGNPPNMTLTYSSPWGNGTANGGDQFSLAVPMNASGTVTVNQNAQGGLSSSDSVAVQAPMSVDTTTAVLTVRYAPESKLYCKVFSGNTEIYFGEATKPAGSPNYEFSYAAVPTGNITLRCGGDKSAPTTYHIDTTR